MTPVIEVDIGMILIAAVANMGFGMLWYSDFMFGERWAKLAGKKASHKFDAGLTYTLAFSAWLIVAFCLEIFLANIPSSNGFTGAMVGFWAGAGFVATTHFINHLFTPGKKSNELYMINVGYHMASMVSMGFLLGL